MRYFILIVGILFVFSPVLAQQTSLFEPFTWDEALQKAKSENKLVFIAISTDNCPACDETAIANYTNNDVQDAYKANFINYQVSPQDNQYSFLSKRYFVESYPAYLYIRPDGTLLYHDLGMLTAEELVNNARLAVKLRNEVKPIAQWDLEYKAKQHDKQFLYDYIVKRSSFGMNNANIIDQYVSITLADDILKKSVLSLLLENNQQINANGSFFRFIIENQEDIKNILSISDNHLHRIMISSIEYTFNKACKIKNETLLETVINAKLAWEPELLPEDSEIVKNEYRAKFYYNTKQPVLLSNYVTLYANTILNQKQKAEQDVIVDTPEQLNESNVNKKALFPSSFSMNEKKLRKTEKLDVAYSFKLRDAAQYVVEMLSNKRMLNNALVWSQQAIELFDNFSNYETHAYVLYKLGKRNEAIASMEKACAVAPGSDGSVREQVESRLIKMKRGERIW